VAFDVTHILAGLLPARWCTPKRKGRRSSFFGRKTPTPRNHLSTSQSVLRGHLQSCRP
jgi:hypothetical protein